MSGVCGCEEEKELGRQQAPGACPYCGGKVEAVDVERHLKLCCFLTICFLFKRKKEECVVVEVGPIPEPPC